MGQFKDSSFEEQRVRMFRFLPQKVATYTVGRFDIFSRLLVSLNISPNLLSILGLLIGAGASLSREKRESGHEAREQQHKF